MTGYPTKRDSVEIDSRAVELLTRAFPGMTVVQTGDQAWDVRPPGMDEIAVTRGDRVIYEPDDGFTIDRDTKNLPAKWSAEEAARIAAATERRQREEAERAEYLAKFDAWVASGSVRGQVAGALRDYVESNDHWGCASHSEGQYCCLDYEHVAFARLVDAIVGAVSPPEPDES